MTDVAAIAASQEGILALKQARGAGVPDSWVRSRCRSGRWQTIHRGIYATHTGPVSFEARCWAAHLLFGRRAVLSHQTAAYLNRMSRAPRPVIIHVTVPYGVATGSTPRGVRVHRRRGGFDGTAIPMRTAPSSTCIDLLPQMETPDQVVGLITDAVRAGARVTRLRWWVERRPRLRHRALALEILGEVAAGVESALELRFRRQVCRRHGLPQAVLQVREVVGGTHIRADALFEEFAVRVELDGEIAHPGGRTDSDTWRDNAVLLERRQVTLRYRWRHIAAMSCETAFQLASALRAGGWEGTLRRCGPACRLPPGADGS